MRVFLLLALACASAEPPAPVEAPAEPAASLAARFDPPLAVTRAALHVRAQLMLAPTGDDIRPMLFEFAAAEREWLVGAQAAELDRLGALDPEARRAEVASGLPRDRLLVVLRAMRAAQLVPVTVDEPSVGGGVAGTASRLFEHTGLWAIGAGVGIDRRLAALGRTLASPDALGSADALRGARSDLDVLTSDLIALQTDLLASLVAPMGFLADGDATALVLGQPASDWMLLPPEGS